MRQLGLFLAAAILHLIVAAPRPAVAAHSTPMEPILAWDIAPDGAVYVLDAAQHVYELDPATLAPVRASARLVPLVSSNSAQLVATSDQIFIASPQLDGIQVLDRASLAPTFQLPIDAAALAAEPPGDDARLFIIRTEMQAQYRGLRRFEVVTVPLANLQAEPQRFGVTAAEPFSSLFDLAVAPDQQLLYVGYADTSGSPNRHYRTYKAYDLQSGEQVDLPIEHQPSSIALRPVSSDVAVSAISYDWLGYEPTQRRIYLVTRDDDTDAAAQPLEGISGPPALDPAGDWLYVVRPRGLWVLRHTGESEYALVSVVPFVTDPPAGVRISPDGSTLYLLGNGWLTALPASDVQNASVEQLGPFPNSWLGQGDPAKQMVRSYAADGTTPATELKLVNLLPSGEWYRSADSGRTWQLLPALQFPDDLGLDLLSISPTLAQDQVATGRGGWGEDRNRTTWRSLDAGATWQTWTPPIAYAAGSEGARTLYLAGAMSPQTAEPQPIPNSGSSENPAWSPGWTHLVFQNNQTGDWEIYRSPAECGELPAGPSEAAALKCVATRLTDSAGDDLLPAWSPDGRMIAFVSLRDGNPEIYVMSADGTQQTRLTYAPGGDWRPAWLPDSRHLVFTSDRSGSNDIFLVTVPDALSSAADNEPRLTPVVSGPSDQRDPAVNAENEMVFLAGSPASEALYTVNLTSFLDAEKSGQLNAAAGTAANAGTALFPDVEQAMAHPGWLPDGRVVFSMGGGIYAAQPYAPRDQFVELVPPEEGAVHPAAGTAWYRPPLASYVEPSYAP
ncbi:MAG: hypothetical protein U0X20_17450 [Caldilineaceae bacterium]